MDAPLALGGTRANFHAKLSRDQLFVQLRYCLTSQVLEPVFNTLKDMRNQSLDRAFVNNGARDPLSNLDLLGCGEVSGR